MSKVSRSTYQKVVEENKRLLNDLRIICDYPVGADATIKRMEYADRFAKEREQRGLIKTMVRQYMNDNPDDPAVKFVKGLKK